MTDAMEKNYTGDEIKAAVKDALRAELTEELRAELREEIKDELRETYFKEKSFMSGLMENKKKIFGGLAIGAVAIIFVSFLINMLVNDGWKVVNDGYKYYEHGKVASGYREIDGIEYIFNEDNMLYEGFVSYNGITYYQDFLTGVYKNESEIDGVKYNFAADGSLTIGTVIRDDGTYLYDMQGYSVTGLTLINEDYYFANDEGLIVFGWQHLDGHTYYFDEETGIMSVGLSEIDGKLYYFNADGELQTGFVAFDEGTKYFLPGGGYVTGKYSIKDKSYLFDEDGYMLTGFMNLDGKDYYYSEADGTMFRGWMLADDKYSYYDTDGSKVYGWFVLESKKYYFDENGYMLTGWQTLEDSERYFDETGAMAYGARMIGGSLYLFDGSGRLVTGDGWYVLNGSRYYRIGDGKIATGFKDIDGATYYFSSTGGMSVGMTKINGNLYYFYGDGTMARNTKIDKFNVDENGIMTNPFATITNENLDAYIEVLLDTYGRDMYSIYLYCRNNFYYKYRDKSDVNSMACRMINNGCGACWDYAALCYKMLKAAGYNCQIVVGKGAYYAEHNWIIIEVSPGVWRHMDPERTHMWVYLKTDAELDALDGSARGIRYQWPKENYPKAE